MERGGSSKGQIEGRLPASTPLLQFQILTPGSLIQECLERHSLENIGVTRKPACVKFPMGHGLQRPRDPKFCLYELVWLASLLGVIQFPKGSKVPPRRTRIFDLVQGSGFHRRRPRARETEQVVQDYTPVRWGQDRHWHPSFPGPPRCPLPLLIPPAWRSWDRLGTGQAAGGGNLTLWPLVPCGCELGPEQREDFSSPAL